MLGRSFAEQIAAATEESSTFIANRPALAATLQDLTLFGNQVILESVPSDFDSLGKIGYFPFTEASTEFSYSLNLALGGAYKPAYLCLRSYLELALVGLHFLALPAADHSGLRWLRSKDPTPFRGAIVKALRGDKRFTTAAQRLGFFERLDELYGCLSNQTHTRGEKHGHIATSKGNFPRFVQEALEKYVTQLWKVSALIATGFAILRPVVLVPLPLDEKFGLNGPLSGFLQDFEVEVVRSFLPQEHVEWLEARSAVDEEAVSAKAWVESLSDLTHEDWDRQVRRQQQWFNGMTLPRERDY